MTYKISGTVVVDDSRNVCACCVTSCCITASDRLDAPSGNTASRPSSPATGSLYFDTDEGSLISYNGSEWASVGSSGFQQKCLTPVTDWIGPYFECCTAGGNSGCILGETCVMMNPHLCQVIITGRTCQCARCGYVKYFTFNPSTCAVTYDCCSCPNCNGSAGLHRPPKFNCCFHCTKRVFKVSPNSGLMFKTLSLFRPEHGCDVNCVHVVTKDATCSFCLCNVGCTSFTCCGSATQYLCPLAAMDNCNYGITPDRCCFVMLLYSSDFCMCCCAGTAQTFTTPAVAFYDGPIVGSTPTIHPIPSSNGLLDFQCNTSLNINEWKIAATFCNGVLVWGRGGSANTIRQALVFMCNNGTAVHLHGNGGACICACENSSTYPTSLDLNGFYRINKEHVMMETHGRRCCTRVYWWNLKHTEGSFCFDVTANCESVTMVRKIVSCTVTTNSSQAGMCVLGHCIPTSSRYVDIRDGAGIFYNPRNENVHVMKCRCCNAANGCICFDGNIGGAIGQIFMECFISTNTGSNPGQFKCYKPLGANKIPSSAIAAEVGMDTRDPCIADTYLPGRVPDKILSDGQCLTKCATGYGCLPCYEGDTGPTCTCCVNLQCFACRNFDQSCLYLAIACLCHQCCAPPSTTLVCKCAYYYRIYCG